MVLKINVLTFIVEIFQDTYYFQITRREISELLNANTVLHIMNTEGLHDTADIIFPQAM